MEWASLLNKTRVKDLYKNTKNQQTTDPRSQFQRDYDRCLFSTPLRRLQDKAQVFPLEPNDSVRTRLTHSLEVSNVARGIAERVGARLENNDELRDNQKQDIIYIASTCGLIHDLGNPPFGHAGEEAMRNWFNKNINNGINIEDIKQKNDFLKFEGNAQTIRLVSKLQMLGDFSGLNLTIATLSASRKYLAESDNIKINENQEFKKLGFFQSEKNLLNKIEKETVTKGKRHPITYIVEAADDIVYSIIDLEDAIKKGTIEWDFIREELKNIIPEIIDKAEENIYNRAINQEFETIDYENAQKRCEFKELKGRALSEARMSILRTELIGYNMDLATEEFISNYNEIMSGTYKSELVHNNSIIKKCKEIAGNNIFKHPSILKLEILGSNIIHDLMSHFWKGIEKYPYVGNKKKNNPFEFKVYSLLSENYKTVFEFYFGNDDIFEYNYLKLQLLADYICGMTDNFAKEMHKEVFNG